MFEKWHWTIELVEDKFYRSDRKVTRNFPQDRYVFRKLVSIVRDFAVFFNSVGNTTILQDKLKESVCHNKNERIKC